ncbi:MAG: AzlC family ABC transporter permease [Devosia sp.]
MSIRSEFLDGVIIIAPLALAATPFGLIFGTEAIRAGLAPAEALLMSAIVFAGSAQFLAIGLWSDPAPWLALGFATLLVNLRHVLMAASLAGKMQQFKPWQRALAAFVLADETWAMAERRALGKPLTPAFYLGAGGTMYVWWLIVTAVGTVIGSYVSDPVALGLDFAFPCVVVCLVLGFAKGFRTVPIVLVSAAVALLTQRLIGGTWFVIAGGLAGMLVAMLLPAPAADGPAREH